MICHQEVARLGYPGFVDSLGAGYMISVPAIFHFGAEWMKQSVGMELLTGQKHSCLAVSEPFAGSDVAAIRTPIGTLRPTRLQFGLRNAGIYTQGTVRRVLEGELPQYAKDHMVLKYRG